MFGVRKIGGCINIFGVLIIDDEGIVVHVDGSDGHGTGVVDMSLTSD